MSLASAGNFVRFGPMPPLLPALLIRWYLQAPRGSSEECEVPMLRR